MINNTKLSSLEETRLEFNPGQAAIKLGIDVHQHFYVMVMQVGGSNPKPAQRFQKEAFLGWAARLARTHRGVSSMPSMKRAGLVLTCNAA